MKVADKIFVAGHQGMVGAALVRRLNKEGFHNLLTRSSAGLDLRNQQKVDAFFFPQNDLIMCYWLQQKLEVSRQIRFIRQNFSMII